MGKPRDKADDAMHGLAGFRVGELMEDTPWSVAAHPVYGFAPLHGDVLLNTGLQGRLLYKS